MDMKQLLPLLLKGRLGEKEKTLLKLTENPDPAALGNIITQMYEEKKNTPRVDLYATLKKIIPAQTLGLIIKYFDEQKRNASRR